MSESKTINVTPPIRSIAAEASSLIGSNAVNSIKIKTNSKSSEEKTRERSSSSSSHESSSSFSYSFTSHSDHHGVYDDVSSNDEINADWEQLRMHTIRRLSKSILKKK
jgi:hypothetical protein